MKVLAHIREQYSLSLGSYGRPRMTMELKEAGLDVGERRVVGAEGAAAGADNGDADFFAAAGSGSLLLFGHVFLLGLSVELSLFVDVFFRCICCYWRRRDFALGVL